jgi:hypothetical protein
LGGLRPCGERQASVASFPLNKRKIIETSFRSVSVWLA